MKIKFNRGVDFLLGGSYLKKILILKMGDTLKSISQKYGEFPQHIINKINLSVDEFIVVDCQRKEFLPRYKRNYNYRFSFYGDGL